MVSPSFHREALRIAEQVGQSAIRSGGRCSWILDRGSEATVLQGGFDDGTAGVALFLAEAGFVDLAREALAHSLEAGDCPAWVTARIDMVLRGHVRDPSLSILDQLEASTTQGDALRLRDAAGLFDLGEIERAREAAAPAAERLIVWVAEKETNGLPASETGLAGGASAVALALAAWSARAGWPSGFAAALNALRQERPWLDSNLGLPGAASTHGFAGGVTGIAIARLGVHHWLGAPSLLAEAGAILSRVRFTSAWPDPTDASLATGLSGLIEAMLLAYTLTGEHSHLVAARRMGEWMVRIAGTQGGYGCSPGYGGDHPGLFTGLAGIGLTLMRLAHPHAHISAYGPWVGRSVAMLSRPIPAGLAPRSPDPTGEAR
jgi:lantibiotic modifying enzyme